MIFRSVSPLRLLPPRFFTVLVCAHIAAVSTASAADHLQRVTATDPHTQTEVPLEGRVLVEARDGGILLEARDGRLHTVTPDQLQHRAETEEPFVPFTADELSAQLRTEFGEAFHVTHTRHYLICSDTNRAYARWCGSLFERLLTSFHSHWKRDKIELRKPEFPLVAVVFADQRHYAEYATADADAATAAAAGYYSVRSNRIVLFDLTAAVDFRPVTTAEEIQRRLSAAPFNIATVVHEATHQIAFNSGLHRRYADNPLWLTEGMAMYFETPDLRSRTGWNTVGKVNRLRLRQFQNGLRAAPGGDGGREQQSLRKLIGSDERFRTAATAGDAYAEAWALTFFLIKTRRDQYADYVRTVSEKRRLIWDAPEKREAEFQAAFGDLEELDQEFLRFMAKLR